MKQIRHLINSLAIMLPLLLVAGCGYRAHADRQRGMYYWSTVFNLDSLKLDFLRAHDIDRLYVRYYDVVLDGSGNPVPNATIRFDSIAASPIEIVPVIFIDNECMKDASVSAHPVNELAKNIIERTLQISETHECGPVNEIQIDCDWTITTRANFYALLNAMRTELNERGITLSTTIRLHQLSQEAPPADRGILMVYNTGDMRRLDVEKPILDIAEVEKYVDRLGKYPLELSAAYPVYRWDLVFRNGKFVDITHSPDDVPMLEGDTIVTRVPTAEDILHTRKLINSKRPDIQRETILFDLNNYNINRFRYDQYESFLD